MRSLLRWVLPVAFLGGLALGLGVYTFVYARGASYLTNDPAACANCHIMSEHYAAWMKSSHRAAATCNDCHTPAGLIPKYAVKASNGFWHSFAFTTGDFPDPLRIKPGNQKVAEGACRKCHGEMVAPMEAAGAHAPAAGNEPLRCVHCHRYVGHWVR